MYLVFVFVVVVVVNFVYIYRCFEADKIGCPRPVSIQNQFSLLIRNFEQELAEACSPRHFDIGLLPWTPLGGGALTGKYLDDNGKWVHDISKIPGAYRLKVFNNFMPRFCKPEAIAATEAYAQIAKKYNVSLTELSLGFCLSRWYIFMHFSKLALYIYISVYI